MRFLGALTARIIGLAAFLAAGLVTYRMALLIQGDLMPANAAAMAIPILMVVLWTLFGALFLIPRALRSALQRRHSFLGRPAARILGLMLIVSLFIFLNMLLRNFGAAPAGFGGVDLVAAPVILVYVLTFVWPGTYARDLANLSTGSSFKTADGQPDEAADHARALLIRSIEDRQAGRSPSVGSQPSARRKPARARPAPVKYWLGMSWSTPFALIACSVFFIGVITENHAHFLPKAARWAMAEELVLPMSIVLGLVAGIPAALDRGAAAKIRSPILRMLLFAPLCGFVAFVYGKAFLAIGAPVIHSQFNKSEPTQLAVTVTEIGSQRQRRSCDYNLYARGSGEYDGPVRKICDLPPDLWERIRPGQRLLLNGFETEYGFRYSSAGG